MLSGGFTRIISSGESRVGIAETYYIIILIITRYEILRLPLVIYARRKTSLYKRFAIITIIRVMTLSALQRCNAIYYYTHTHIVYINALEYSRSSMRERKGFSIPIQHINFLRRPFGPKNTAPRIILYT